MRNVRLTVQYDGTAYAGFALQPNGVSVAEKLAAAIAETTGAAPHLTVAGRTDAGVHARGQVVNFHTDTRIPAERLAPALNTRLPADIRVLAATDAPADFHARYAARSKIYIYTVDNSPVRSPLWARYAAHEPRRLDLAAMQEAARLLEGRRDFAAFRSTGGAAKTSVRHMLRCEVWAEARGPAGLPDPGDGRLVRILTEADGFLYNMVRIIAGTLLDVGTGKRTLEDVQTALATGDRRRAGKTAPPRGLTLELVRY